MKDFAFRMYRSKDRPAVASLAVYAALSHPVLTAAELERLAQRIATADGIPSVTARRQIAQFRGASFPLEARADEPGTVGALLSA